METSRFIPAKTSVPFLRKPIWRGAAGGGGGGGVCVGGIYAAFLKMHLLLLT